MRLNILLTR